jgi:wobble nucleotide-excising tRNase
MSKEDKELEENIKDMWKRLRITYNSTIQEYIEALTGHIKNLEKKQGRTQEELKVAQKRVDKINKELQKIGDEIVLAEGEQTIYFTLKLERGEKTKLGAIKISKEKDRN